jgi:hypothetical protein
MRFSEAFGLTRSTGDDWFDPHLTIDTQLFIDPILLILAGGEWLAGHDELVDHFTHCYKLVASADGPQSLSAKAARRMLTFPEPSEFCLGYTSEGTAGSGTAGKTAERLADGIAVALARGIQKPDHIEEIGILNPGIGADRISDAVCNVLKRRFIAYTQQVCRDLGVPMEVRTVRNASVSLDHARWLHQDVEVPINPTNGRPVLLIPQALLNDLPELNARSWFDDPVNEDIRLQLNLSVGQRVTKAQIVDLARRNADRVVAWARNQISRPDLHGYDFDDDPRGVWQFDKETVNFAQRTPLKFTVNPPSNTDELIVLVREVVENFKHFIEQRGGWELLWDSAGNEKPESAAQLLLMAMAGHYLRLFDVEVDREVDLGRGPVDFKFSSGTKARLVLELKKVHNGKFWNGIEYQLPSYMHSDQSAHGWFVAIRYRNNKNSEDRVKSLATLAKKVETAGKIKIELTNVDARKPASASKIKKAT